MAVLEFQVATGDPLSVRRFSVREAISVPFSITIVARTPDPSLDLDAIVGQPASFQIVAGDGPARERRWEGVIRLAEQEQAEPSGLSTYRFILVPSLWRMSQRRDHRIYEHHAAPIIAEGLCDLWKIEHARALGEAHPVLPYKVQYGETDYSFFCRILEEAGIAFTFPEAEGKAGVLTLADRLHEGSPREALIHASSPAETSAREWLTEVRLTDQSRAGAFSIRDHDLRRPAYRLLSEAEKAKAPEDKSEQYHYRPGASLIETTPSGDTPAADDGGAARHDDAAGKARAQRSLDAARADKRTVDYRTNVLDLWPGRVFSMTDHPHPALPAGQRLLAAELSIEGTFGEEWQIRGRAVFADSPYRPPLRAPRPRARLQCATVIGPEGGEIHTDEFGRARVHFPWDRGAAAGTWLRVSQGWAGAGYGMMALPRVGQEVLVDFAGGDPEQPFIVGRVYNQTNPVIERLPQNATKSIWKSNTSPASVGFNEISIEDAKGKELLYGQAERDARRLVKNDEAATVVRDRKKVVTVSEVETTDRDRVQETKRDRVELDYADKTVSTGATDRERVKKDDIERIETEQVVWIGKDAHLITAGVRRELVEQDGHLLIQKSRQESVGGGDSLSVHERYDESVGSYSVDASGKDGWIHLMAGSAIVIDAAADASLVAGGNFVDVGPAGVTIVGSYVAINEGGGPGSLPGAGPRLPEKPKVAEVEEPPAPREPSPSDPKVGYEIVVVDEWESPVAGLDFTITTPSGTLYETTDTDGRIKVEAAPDAASAYVRRPEDLGGLLAGSEKKERRKKPLPEGEPWHVRTPTDAGDTVILPQGKPQKMMIVCRTDLSHHASASGWIDHTLSEAAPAVQVDSRPLAVQMQSDATGAQAVVTARSTQAEKDEPAAGVGEWMRAVVDSLHDALFKGRFDVVFSILEQIPLDPPRLPEPELPEPTAERESHRAAIEALRAQGLVDPPFTPDPEAP